MVLSYLTLPLLSSSFYCSLRAGIRWEETGRETREESHSDYLTKKLYHSQSKG